MGKCTSRHLFSYGGLCNLSLRDELRKHFDIVASLTQLSGLLLGQETKTAKLMAFTK